jgi:AmmeMemoRadiSam system protein B
VKRGSNVSVVVVIAGLPPILKSMDPAAHTSRAIGPAVAGAFYPADPGELSGMVRAMLEHAGPREAPDEPVPRALIVPHAGFVYSGPVAASAYRLIRPAAGRIRKVVLLGPSHRVPFRGLAVPESDALATPLGEVPVDQALKAKATKLAVVDEADLAHAREHCLEVQLPFLQALLPDFSVLPVVVGECTDRAVLELLESLPLEEPDTLLVVSSDLSHYHDYATARGMDSETVDAILRLAPEALDGQRACGYKGIRGLLLWARGHGMSARLVDLRSSGDTAGDRRQVVGYAAVAFD